MARETLDILVVDDESELREQIKRLFTRDGHRVMAVADGRSALDRACTGHFDIVLLDVALGGGPDGYEVCRTLRERRNVVPVIMLTALDSEADAVLGLEAGADDYVTKPFGPAELRSRIRAVLRRAGPRALGDEVLKVGPIVLDRSRRTVTAHDRPVELTFSEFELLQALMSRPGGNCRPPILKHMEEGRKDPASAYGGIQAKLALPLRSGFCAQPTTGSFCVGEAAPEAAHGGRLDMGQDVGVDVEGSLYPGVAEDLLQNFGGTRQAPARGWRRCAVRCRG
jgi:DNA-binding response OmpR family regulator